ncbi:MAG: FKBP-type peptidyl-prolyl cis-trans isomerase [Bacteroidales bacterium]|nr:FKBP-type peptidyl-prolyl cis-trans isomerase [Bacteroidales bacterium]
MKTIKILAISALAIALAASCKNAPKVDAPLPTGAEIDSVSYLIGVNFGYFIKANNFADKLGDLNFSQLKKGMSDFIAAEGQMGSEEFNANFKINPDKMNEIFNNFITKRNQYIAAVNLKEGQDFLEKLYNKGGIEKTESGLLYEIIEDGDEVKAGPADTVWCHYTGTLIDGTKFDGTEPDSEPARFTLDRVIKGWTEGMQLVGQGGKIKLYIPAELAYGERPMGNTIKPNSTLIFDVEITKVGKKPVEETEETAE